jgi:hypothetical protein
MHGFVLVCRLGGADGDGLHPFHPDSERGYDHGTPVYTASGSCLSTGNDSTPPTNLSFCLKSCSVYISCKIG